MLEKNQSLAEAISAVILFGQLAAPRHDRATLKEMGVWVCDVFILTVYRDAHNLACRLEFKRFNFILITPALVQRRCQE